MSGSAMSQRAEATAGGVLLTLASGQFLMTLDSSVMNVAIADGGRGRRHDGHRYPGGHHPVHAGDGDHGCRRKDRT
jgi:hypothetical protein